MRQTRSGWKIRRSSSRSPSRVAARKRWASSSFSARDTSRLDLPMRPAAGTGARPPAPSSDRGGPCIFGAAHGAAHQGLLARGVAMEVAEELGVEVRTRAAHERVDRAVALAHALRAPPEEAAHVGELELLDLGADLRQVARVREEAQQQAQAVLPEGVLDVRQLLASQVL